MLFFGKENVSMCLVAFQKMFRKIFSDVWLYSWKYHRKHMFYLLLTFSHIFSVTKRIYNIIHSSKHKQNPKKKSSNPDKRRRDCDRWDRDQRDHDRRGWRFMRSRSTRSSDRDRHGVGDVAISSFFLPLSLSLSSIFQGQKTFEVKMETKMIFRCFGSHFWSTGNDFRSTRNAFQFDRIWSNNQTPHFLENHFRNQFEVNSNVA